jgi:long-chain acyl-CoA synthetase
MRDLIPADLTPADLTPADLTPADLTLVALPLGYLYGLSTAAAVGLQAGSTVVVLPRFHPCDVLEGLVAHRASVFHGVPTIFSMMLDDCP